MHIRIITKLFLDVSGNRLTENSRAVQYSKSYYSGIYFVVVVVQSLRCVQLFVTIWTTICQASLSIIGVNFPVIPELHFCFSLLYETFYFFSCSSRDSM